MPSNRPIDPLGSPLCEGTLRDDPATGLAAGSLRICRRAVIAISNQVRSSSDRRADQESNHTRSDPRTNAVKQPTRYMISATSGGHYNDAFGRNCGISLERLAEPLADAAFT
jgi:hypothetical protein